MSREFHTDVASGMAGSRGLKICCLSTVSLGCACFCFSLLLGMVRQPQAAEILIFPVQQPGEGVFLNNLSDWPSQGQGLICEPVTMSRGVGAEITEAQSFWQTWSCGRWNCGGQGQLHLNHVNGHMEWVQCSRRIPLPQNQEKVCQTGKIRCPLQLIKTWD